MNLETAVTCLFKFADDMALVGLLLKTPWQHIFHMFHS